MFARMMADLNAKQGDGKTVRIDAKYFNAQRTTTNLGFEEGAWTPDWPAKSGMATELHAICDSQGRSLNLFAAAGQVSACSGARAMIHSLPSLTGSLATVAMMLIGSAKRL